jgi:hypothetical protein
MEIHPKLTQQTEQELLNAQQSFIQAGARSAAQVVSLDKREVKPVREKKQSLFARKMGLVRKEDDQDSGAIITSIREKDSEEMNRLSREYEIPLNGFPNTFKLEEEEIKVANEEIGMTLQTDSEELAIHQENLQKIQSMSKEEIEQNIKEIYDTIDPKMISMLQAKAQRRKALQKVKASPCSRKIENNPLLTYDPESLKSSISTPSITCAHDPSPPTSQFDMFRFDSDAKIVQRYSNNIWAGEDTGFSIKEWSNLIRSALPSQRSLSLLSLKTILSSSLPFSSCSALNFLIEKCSLSVSLRYSLDDKNMNVQTSALKLIHYILTLYNEINLKVQQYDSMIFPTILSPANNVLLSSDQRNFKEIWEEEVTRHDFSQDTEESSDNDLCQLDLIGGLIRMGMLQRLCYLINLNNANEVIDILISCALHSVTACYAIVRTKDLLDNIMSLEYREAKLFRLLGILSKGSLSIAYMIKKYSNIWIPAILNHSKSTSFHMNPESLDLLASQLLYIKEFAIDNMREIYLDMCRNIENDDGLARCWLIVTRSYLLTKRPEIYKGFVEIGLYRYVHNIEDMINDKKISTLSQVARFLNYSVQEKKYSVEYAQIVPYCLRGLEILIDRIDWNPLLICDVESCEAMRRLDRYFSIDWEYKHQTYYNLLSELISLSTSLNLSPPDKSRFTELFNIILSNLLSLLFSILDIFRFSERINPIVLYRLQSLRSLLLSYLRFSPSTSPHYNSSLYLSFLLLSSYSEYTLEFLLSKLPSSSLSYYRGFLNTDKHLDYSSRFLTSSKSVPSYYLSNKETQYLPLPFNWAFLPLATEKSDLISYISVCKEYISTLSSLPLYSIIPSINQLFMRNDINLAQFESEILSLLRSLVQKPEFGKAFRNIKENIMLVVKHYCAESYCDRLYSIWIVSLYEKCEIESLKRCIEDEMGPLLSRAKTATEGISLS